MANKQLAIIENACKQIAPRYRHVALSNNLNWSNEKQHLITVVNKTWQLQKSTVESIRDAALQAGSMGLSLNPNLHHCYLIPRRKRKQYDGESKTDYDNKVPFLAHVSPSYRGLAHLAVGSGGVKYLRADIVFNDDVFEYYGAYKDPKYIGNSINTGKRTEGDAKGVFAVAETQDGAMLCEFIDRVTIQTIRQMSEMPNGAIWNPKKFWSEGWKKAAIRRLYKTLPDSNPAMTQAIGVMNEHEGLARVEKDITPELETLSDDQANVLHAKLIESGLAANAVEPWLNKLATRYGVGSYSGIPVDKFNDACKVLDDALSSKVVVND